MKENNELIAEFLGWIRHDANSSYNLPQWYKPDEKDLRKKGVFKGYPEQLKFHQSFDWLMPVVEKINKMGYDVDIFSTGLPRNTHECTIHDTGNVYCCINDAVPLIEAVYRSVVDFIEWNNTRPKSQIKPIESTDEQPDGS